MGFTTGFLGGITLTYSVIYLTVYAHRQNRTHQSLLLRQQSRLLNSVVDPPETEYEPPAYRVEQAGLEELLKDRWNREVENLVRKAQHTDWEAVRIRWEDRLGNAWAKVRGIEQVQDLEQRVRDGAKDLKENVSSGAQDLKDKTISGAQDLRDNVKSGAQDLNKSLASGAQDLRKNVASGAEKLRDNIATQSERAKDNIVAQTERAKDTLIGSGREAKDAAKASANEAIHGKRILDL